MRNVLFATSSRLIVIAAQLAYVKLYSNYLTSHELGIYYFLVTASYSLNALLLVPLDYYQQSRVYSYLKEKISFRSLLLFNKKCLLITSAGICLLAAILSPIQAEHGFYVLLAGGLAILIYLGNALKGLLNNLEHRGFVSAIMALEAALKVIVFYLFVLILPSYASTLLASAILALSIILVPLVLAARRLENFKSGHIVPIEPMEVFRFVLPISIGAVLNWLQLQGYRMVLVPLGFTEMVGIYATVSGIGSAGMGAAAAVFNQVFTPRIYKTSGGYTREFIRNALLVVAAIIAFCIFFSAFLVEYLTNHAFVEFSPLVIYGVLTEAGNFIIGAIAVHLTIANQTKRILLASCIGLATMIVCFFCIYATDRVSTYTIGLPLVISQVIAAAFLYVTAWETREFAKVESHADLNP